MAINAASIQPETVSIVRGVNVGLAIRIMKVIIVPNDNPIPELERSTIQD